MFSGGGVVNRARSSGARSPDGIDAVGGKDRVVDVSVALPLVAKVDVASVAKVEVAAKKLQRGPGGEKWAGHRGRNQAYSGGENAWFFPGHGAALYSLDAR